MLDSWEAGGPVLLLAVLRIGVFDWFRYRRRRSRGLRSCLSTHIFVDAVAAVAFLCYL
jgi:hypothetical protein